MNQIYLFEYKFSQSKHNRRDFTETYITKSYETYILAESKEEAIRKFDKHFPHVAIIDTEISIFRGDIIDKEVE